MFSHRTVLLIGACVAAALALVALIGVATEQWVLAAFGGITLVAAQFVVQIDNWRRTRSLRNYVRDEVRRASLGSTEVVTQVVAPNTAAPEDVVGAVRLMQAQYVGRLDRLQTALDDAVAQLRETRR